MSWDRWPYTVAIFACIAALFKWPVVFLILFITGLLIILGSVLHDLWDKG